MLKKIAKWENDELLIFLKNPNFEFSFLDNPAISGPGKCKIWNLCFKMSKTPKYCLWEMIGTFYLCFQEISMKHTRSYWALCISVIQPKKFSRESPKIRLSFRYLFMEAEWFLPILQNRRARGLRRCKKQVSANPSILTQKFKQGMFFHQKNKWN